MISSDLLLLRSMLFQEMLFDMSITDIGGSLATCIEDVMLCQYHKEFDLLVDVTSTTVFSNGEKDIVVKLRHVPEYLVVSQECNSQILDLPSISPSECSQNDENSPTPTHETLTMNNKKRSLILDLPSLSPSEFTQNDENSPPPTHEAFTMNNNNSHTLGCDTSSTDFVESDEDSNLFQPRFHSTQKRKRVRVDKPHLLSREREVSSAYDTSKKFPSEVSETDQLILTLPNEGEEEWEINQHIVAAMRAGKLSQHMNAFLLVCAKHLLKTVSLDKRLNQRKSIYKRYAQMIVKQHPCHNNCEDNYLTVKHKVVRAVGNQIDSKKHGRIRNLKRNQQKASAKRNSGGVSQSDAANSTSGNLSTAVDDDFPDHKSEEELRRKHDFEARREFFKINTKLSLAKLLEKTPYYHDFEKAYDDFLMMYPMSCITEEKFQKAFETTLLTFRRFLERNSGKGGQKWPEGAKMDLEVLLAVNALCSTSRGVKGAKPVFVIREVGKNVEPDYSGVNSSAIVFFNGNSLHSMLIIVGSSCNVNYKNINVSSVCQVVLNLLSVYYVTDCNYPAMYGVLSLIDRWCLHQEGFQRQKPVQKDSFSMSAFLKKYDKFVLNDDGDQHQAQELPSEEDSS